MNDSPWTNDEFADLRLSGIDEKFKPGTAQEIDFLVRTLCVRSGDSIIDLGCGAGRHAIELARRGFNVVALDISSRMLHHARQRARQAGVNIEFMQIDLADLASGALGDRAFDGALCLCESGLGVLGGWKRDLEFLKCVLRLLRPGCSFAITTLNALRHYRNPGKAFDFVQGVVHWSCPHPSGGGTLQQDQRLYAPSELRLLVEAAGFNAVRLYGCAPGRYEGQRLAIDDVEIMLVATRPRDDGPHV